MYFKYTNQKYFPRKNYIKVGYHGILSNQISSAFVKYSFPLFYPDFRLRSLFYCKRVKSAIFYNHAFVIDNDKQYNSVGLDLTFDYHAFRLIFPIETGYRIAYLPDLKDYYHQFLFSLNINALL